MPAPVVMYRIRETGWERAEGGRIKNTEGRSEKEDDGAAGGVPEDRRRCGLRPTYRFGGLTFRGGEGVDGRGTHTYTCVHATHAAPCDRTRCTMYGRRRHMGNVVRKRALKRRYRAREWYPPFVYVLPLAYNSACLRKRSPRRVAALADF